MKIMLLSRERFRRHLLKCVQQGAECICERTSNSAQYCLFYAFLSDKFVLGDFIHIDARRQRRARAAVDAGYDLRIYFDSTANKTAGH